MRIHLKGGRFGSKTLDQMLAEDHLRALINPLRELGASVSAGDTPERPDVEVHIEAQEASRGSDAPTVCVQLENRFIWPANTKERLDGYEHLVTWDRSREGADVTHIFPPVAMREPRRNAFANRPALAAIVATNRAENTSSPNELYSERVRIIRAFEKRPDLTFELWGRGWNLPPQPPGLAFSAAYKFLRGVPMDIARLRNNKGPCGDKDDALERAVFNFCFENVSGLSGYVTEKIFDSLIAGAVPIYLGCDDIGEYVPEDCFIAYERVRDIDQFIDRLCLFGPEDYESFDRARLKFLASPRFSEHSVANFGDTTAKAIVRFLDTRKAGHRR
ncbi:glycosyltransferase family 10 domain-containing protein [Erythrobacter sp. GH1-10]|uniref:glycosyltransferase family 10 domain-containing protein n=1 Tax=Erythrobacter sp. GH1-10 TaxID=3349334 RepID=UPI003877BEEE